MKKALLTLTALSMAVSVSACGMHDGYDNNGQQSDAHLDWMHRHHAHMAEDFFNAMDTNADGVVTRKEYNAYTREWFREADANHDGKLTLEEVKAQMKRQKMSRMQQNDANNNNNGLPDNENSRYYDNQSNK